VWRRLFHISVGSLIPIAGIFLAEEWMVWALAALAGATLLTDLARFNVPWLNRVYLRWLAPILKQDEAAHVTGATYMLIAATVVWLLYGKEVGVPVMFYLSLGDPVAALVGRRVPGPRLLGKSPGGTIAFAAVGAAAAAVLLGAEAIEHHWALWAGAGIAAVVELASIPPDDNLTIPLVAGTAMHFLMVV
jgi:dolichol kinase